MLVYHIQSCHLSTSKTSPFPNNTLFLQSSLSLSKQILSLHAPSSFASLSTMVLRISRSSTIILGLSLLLLVLIHMHGYCSLVIVNHKSNNIEGHGHHLSLPQYNRKALAIRYDFTTFIHHHHHHHRHHQDSIPGPTEPEIDPRYGVDKRLVPTGPNRLHH